MAQLLLMSVVALVDFPCSSSASTLISTVLLKIVLKSCGKASKRSGLSKHLICLNPEKSNS